MKSRERKRLDKVLFALLGRRPDAFGVVLEEGGWLSFKGLHRALAQEPGFSHLRPSGIRDYFTTFRPERFQWEGTRVRVRPEFQDWSRIEDARAEPPARLYFPVRARGLISAVEHGIGRPGGGGKRVVLAVSKEMAERMGRYRDPAPVVLTVLAQKAWRAGTCFSSYGEELFLADHVPAEYIISPRIPRELKKKRGKADRPPSGPRPGVHAGAGTFALQPRDLAEPDLVPHGRRGHRAARRGRRRKDGKGPARRR